MFNPWLLSALGIGYMLLLFMLAGWADRNPNSRFLRSASAWIYSLAIAVYLSSWSYYGLVDNAQNYGWLYLSTNLGPLLFFLFAIPALVQLFRYRQQHNITSIADYIAFRFDRDSRLALMVTLISVAIAVPYLALQVKSTAAAYSFLVSGTASETLTSLAPTALAMTAILTLFAMLFGTRILGSQERNAGLMVAIAFGSIIKLLAFVAVAVFALLWLQDLDGQTVSKASISLGLDNFHDTLTGPLFWVNLLLGVAGIICLPRQFHVTVVEGRDVQDLHTARWVLPLYSMLFLLLTIPIALASQHYLSGLAVAGDLSILALPVRMDSPMLALISFMGGVSAAATMFVVSMIALTIMVSNHIILPLLLRRQTWLAKTSMSFETVVLLVRRIGMASIAVLAFLFYLLIDRYASLTSLGYLSLALALQLAPAVGLSLTRRSIHKNAILAGMIAGSIVWLGLLLVPSLLAVEPYFSRQPLPPQPDQSWLVTLAGIDIAWRTLTSLGCNLLALLSLQWLSARTTNSHAAETAGNQDLFASAGNNALVTLDSLYELTANLCGKQRTEQAFTGYLGSDQLIAGDAIASPDLLRYCERLLAASVGQVSARRLLIEHLGTSTGHVQSDAAVLKNAYAAIRFNRKMLEAILENIDLGVSILDQDLCLVGWNQRYMQLMHYPHGTLYQGQPISELMHINAQQGYFGDDNAQQQISESIALIQQSRPLHKIRDWRETGSIIEVIGKPLGDHGYMLTYSDISDIRQAEQELRQYTDNIPTAMCYTDKREIIRFANKAFARMAGLSREAMIGRPIKKVLSEQDYLQQSTQRAQATAGERVDFETSFVIDDELRHFHIDFIPFIDVAGRNNGFYSISQDITSFRQIEQELRQKERDVRQYTEHSPVMLLYIDPDYRIRFANRAFMASLGNQNKTIVGEHIEAVLPQHLVEHHHERRVAVMQGKTLKFEAEYVDELDQKRYLEVGYFPDRDPLDPSIILGYYTVALDITERKLASQALTQANLNLERRVQERTTELHNLNLKLMQANQHAQEANASKTRFLAAASHDLLQPMNAARLFIAVVMESRDTLKPNQLALIEQIDHSLETSERLLAKLLEISRLDSGFQRTDIEVFNIHKTMLPLAESFQLQCKNKGIRLRMHCNDALWTRSDPQLLYRMVQNLLANAVRHTQTGGVLISNRLLRKTGCIRIAVHDTGPGIPASEQQAIFREFHQLKQAANDATGLGLGLAIVERLGHLLNHPIGLRSRFGSGSCFWIDVPIADAIDAQPSADNNEHADNSSRFLQARKVLCIDDDHDSLAGLCGLLESWGADVCSAASADQALEQIHKHGDIAIVLSDYRMHGDNSMNTLQRLQELTPQHLHIIIITAEQLPASEANIQQHGFALLHKPLRPAKLRKLLQNLTAANAPTASSE